MTPEQLRKLQLIELDQLKVFADLCERHNLTYYLYGGTLLGAVRHKGFIPWDDDIDVAMPRADYNRFQQIAAMELPDGYYLETPEGIPGNPYYMTRIRKQNTIYESNWVRRFKLPCTGIWIDIFPLDDEPAQTSIQQRIDGYLFDKVLTPLIKNHARSASDAKSLKAKIGLSLIKLLPFTTYQRLRDRVARRHEGKNLPYCLTYAGIAGYEKETYAKSILEPAAKLEFEGRMYSVPGDWDGWLKHFYGDYMQLPPVEKRMPHPAVRVSFDTAGPDEILQ